MAVWVIGDLHLSFGVPNKEMHVFGEQWRNHPDKIAAFWRSHVGDEDLVLIPGDISWAKHLEDAIPDLLWIHDLPGTKVMIRGNHDYWWSSLSKAEKILPPSIHLVQNNAFLWKNIAIGGSRLWDTAEYDFDDNIPFLPAPTVACRPLTEKDQDEANAEQIFTRELSRLEMSLKALSPRASVRIAMTHYPPIGPLLAPSRASHILEKYKIQYCVFGHLHSVDPTVSPLFGEKNGVHYFLTAADYLDFHLLRLPIE